MVEIRSIRNYNHTTFMIQMQETISTENLIRKSICLKIVMITLLFSITGAVVESIIFARNNCSVQLQPYSKSCRGREDGRNIQCSHQSDQKAYCCDIGFMICGELSHCTIKSKDYNDSDAYSACYHFHIATICFVGLSILLGVGIIAKILCLRYQAKRQEENMINQPQEQNTIINSDSNVQDESSIIENVHRNMEDSDKPMEQPFLM